ncbi:Ankyrin (plasmid) [Rhodoferax ferrireducens T118]|uniref:Ankyrin n=1 Tax=Albidiferax ferrireducens (strain ATCC BAA-621 / DSM 15236 / T118) TaxID=338969 RepID=Q21Q78_ALBFT|nr:ankyrin repeat domain-containing protein [Rhodoferax ferrireducens]ABD72067.1 Ankyrin [Rhodoferax ferrireducens T118]
MIERHHKISHLRRDLSRTSDGRWLAQAPGEMIDGFLCSPAALASWVYEAKPEFLAKPSLGVLILGSMLDGFDGGAWWTLFSTLLGKGSGWAKFTVMVPEDEGPIQRSGLPPAPLARSVQIIRGNLFALAKMEQSEIDVVYLPFGNPDTWVPILQDDARGLWRFLNQNASIVMGLIESSDAPLCMEVAKMYELDVRRMSNRFYAPTSETMAQTKELISAHGKKPADFDLADDRATNLTEVSDVIKDLCTTLPGVEPEDYRLWGMRSVIKSSVDSQDFYISLPRKLAVRVSTGRIYRITDDLATGEPLRCTFPPGGLTDYPGPESHWSAKVFWAGRVWEGGLGNFYNDTVGAAFDKLGLGELKVAEFIDMIGGNEDHEGSQRLKNAMTGGQKYSPTRDERFLFDMVDKRDEQAVLALVRENRQLLNSFNEDRLPLLVMLGLRNMPETMAKVIDLGANPRAIDGGERPILVELAGRGNRDVVKAILNAGVSPNCQDALGWTPLLYSMKSRRWEIVQLLLDCGADTQLENSFGVSPKGIALDQKTKMDDLAEMAMDLMGKLMDPKTIAALKAAGMELKSSDIPQPIRDQILAS